MTDQTPATASRSLLITTTPAPPGEWDPINVVTTLPPDVALAGSITGFVFTTRRRGTKRSPVYQDDPR